AFIATAVDERAPYRAAIRKAADRALEPLQVRLADGDPHVVAAAAELMGLTGSPQAVPLLAGLLRHPSDFVREAALLGLAEGGGRRRSTGCATSLTPRRGACWSCTATTRNRWCARRRRRH